MEKNGIGTDASIPVHINNICERNYVQVGSRHRAVVCLSFSTILGYSPRQIAGTSWPEAFPNHIRYNFGKRLSIN